MHAALLCQLPTDAVDDRRVLGRLELPTGHAAKLLTCVAEERAGPRVDLDEPCGIEVGDEDRVGRAVCQRFESVLEIHRGHWLFNPLRPPSCPGRLAQLHRRLLYPRCRSIRAPPLWARL